MEVVKTDEGPLSLTVETTDEKDLCRKKWGDRLQSGGETVEIVTRAISQAKVFFGSLRGTKKKTTLIKIHPGREENGMLNTRVRAAREPAKRKPKTLEKALVRGRENIWPRGP